MGKKQSVMRIFAILAACTLIGITIGLISAQAVAWREYKVIAQIIGTVKTANPQMEGTLIQALKSPDSEDFTAGNIILQKYSYSQNIFCDRNTAEMVGISILLMLILGAFLAAGVFFFQKKRKGRIERLTTYLEAVNLGRDTLLVRQEDDFSHLEDELYKTVTELRQSRENALRERQLLADNLADISHQLKTPITSMSLMTQLLADSCHGEDADYVENLSRQLRRLEALVSSLLKLSRLDAGTLKFKEEPVDVYAMLIRAAEPVEDTLCEKHQQLVIGSESETFFMGDTTWIAEAFLNLIKNCSEHTPRGGIITIRYAQNPLYTEIIVEDNGKGFSKEDIPHLFQRFYKGKNAAKDSAGIGLAISKSIITKQNGSIQAENAPNGGARFVVKFYA